MFYFRPDGDQGSNRPRSVGSMSGKIYIKLYNYSEVEQNCQKKWKSLKSSWVSFLLKSLFEEKKQTFYYDYEVDTLPRLHLIVLIVMKI